MIKVAGDWKMYRLQCYPRQQAAVFIHIRILDSARVRFEFVKLNKDLFIDIDEWIKPEGNLEQGYYNNIQRMKLPGMNCLMSNNLLFFKRG